MNYWWVNQNQTYKNEVFEGFLWSPKVNKNGIKNPFYDFMKEVIPGDIIFSYYNMHISAIGISTSNAISSLKPNFGKTGQQWNDDGWFIKTCFKELNKPLNIKEYYNFIKNDLPLKYSPFCENGNISQSYLFKIENELANKIIALMQNDFSNLINEIYFQINNNYLKEDTKSNINEDFVTEKEQIVYRRIGQNTFKANIYRHEKSCRVTGIKDHKHLIASHIKPWSESTNYERINEFNGLLLAPHIDHLFDKGFISFDNEGNLLISNKLDSQILPAWGLERNKNVGRFKKEQIKFLEYHRKKFNFE